MYMSLGLCLLSKVERIQLLPVLLVLGDALGCHTGCATEVKFDKI